MRQCLFCDSTSLTLEHVWPDWAVQQFRRRHTPSHQGYIAKKTDDAGVRSWKARDLEQKTRAACASCNNGWMSAVEAETKPVITSLIHRSITIRDLTVLDQCTIAAWATLRSMVFETLLPVAKRFYTQAQRVAFRDDPFMTPPENTHIWLVMVLGGTADAKLNVANQPHEGSQIIHLTNFSLGQAFFQVLCWRDGAIRQERLARGKHHEVATRLWPSDGNVIPWPPPFHLGADNWNDFAQRFFELKTLNSSSTVSTHPPEDPHRRQP